MKTAVDNANQEPEFMKLAQEIHNRWSLSENAGETLEPASPQPVRLLVDYLT